MDDLAEKPWTSFEEEPADPAGLSLLLELTAGTELTEREIQIGEIHPLTSEDLLEAKMRGGLPVVKLATIKKIRRRHHHIASLLAADLTHAEVSAITGTGPSRIAGMLQDPSFVELVTHYQRVQKAQAEDLVPQLGVFAGDVLSELQDRLEDNPEDLSTSILLEALKITSDRAGFGPQQTNRNLNLSAQLSPKEVEAIRNVSRNKEYGRINRQGPGSPGWDQPHLLAPIAVQARGKEPVARSAGHDAQAPSEETESEGASTLEGGEEV